MWGFEEARQASKDFLVAMDNSITKFEIATRYEYDDWLRRAYKELANRPKSLSIEEAKRIGIEAATHVAQVREVRLGAQHSLQVLHTEARVHFGTRNWITVYRCPHGSHGVQPREFPYSDNESTASGTHSLSATCYKCELCGVTFYDDKTIVDKTISGRIDDAILNIIPEKTCEEPQKADDREVEVCARADTPGSFEDFGDVDE